MMMLLRVALFLVPAAARLQPRQSATIPDFVNKYAPLVYLDENEQWMPSDIGTQLNNTYPAVNFTAIRTSISPLTLSNLDQLNAIAHCNVDAFDNCPLYLTSSKDVATNPPWLYGVSPDPVTHETVGVKSCAIIVNDHGDGIVDAYYMYFYAFNYGNTVFGQVLGNHVGDWEHTMVRFTNGKPTTMWYSQHDSGQTFTYDAVSKNGSRPIVYSAIGSHANFAVPGTHSRVIATVTVNDFTSAGLLWDPTLSSYYYTFEPTTKDNGTFTPSDSSFPSAWLYYLGRWGDEQYPDSDPRQVNFFNLSVEWKWTTGPTGPLDKDLNRTGTCPGNASQCTTLTALPASSGSTIPVTISRTSSATRTSSTLPLTGSSSASSTGSSSPLSTGTSSGSASSPGTTSAGASRSWEAPLFAIVLGLLMTLNL